MSWLFSRKEREKENDEAAEIYGLKPGYVLWHGKPLGSLDVAAKLREADQKAILAESRMKFAKDILSSPAVKDALGAEVHARIMEFMDSEWRRLEMSD